jgi:hypothetical protein
MEVHHHAHSVPETANHRRKKWTHYFWEFMMLFLAVFCGFMAENFREHRIEHYREKQFMRSMVEDLKSDTSLLAYASRYWDTINHSIDSVANAIQFSNNNVDLAKLYRHYNKALDYNSFVYNDRTISQLKNSGGFRLIRNNLVANKIILFDQFNNDAMKNIAEIHASFYKTAMQLANKVVVQEVINEYFDRFGNEPAPRVNRVWSDSLLNQNKIPLAEKDYYVLLFEFKNALLAYRKDFANMKYGYDHLKFKMNELITMIKSEYHLPN